MPKTALTTSNRYFAPWVSPKSSVHLINLGCARNLVDSQVILGRLKQNGYRIVDSEHSDVAIVNTCSFIEDARRESIDVILDLIDLKEQGKIKKIIVAGCLAQRYGKDLVKELKGVDAFVGTLTLDKEKFHPQVTLTPKHYAYVKICESCYNKCSFCAIPKIKGQFISRTIESVVEEVKQLDSRGVKEIDIVGQDITAYGMDIYKKKCLSELLKALIPVTKNIQWIRLLYAFPAHVTDELIDLIANEEKICKYIDMPLQHISDRILRSMNRGVFQKGTLELVRKLKAKIPQGSLRTTFIVGFPGETEEDFQQLLSFVQATCFERMGVFVYSREEGTAADTLTGHVPEKIKKQRMGILMNAQREISQNAHEKFLGKTLKVLIDEKQKGEEGVYLGRSEFDAPEVDGLVYAHCRKALRPGDFVDVRITASLEYDLVGDVV